MKAFIFAKRCAKEILRDPINLMFGLGFPVVLLLLLSVIQANIPVPLFEIAHLTPGITVFGLSFITLFSATLIAKDRDSAFLQRLYTTPLRSSDFILGYMLPVLPIAVAQCIVCYLVAIALGLPVTVHIVYAALTTPHKYPCFSPSRPIALLFSIFSSCHIPYHKLRYFGTAMQFFNY